MVMGWIENLDFAASETADEAVTTSKKVTHLGSAVGHLPAKSPMGRAGVKVQQS